MKIASIFRVTTFERTDSWKKKSHRVFRESRPMANTFTLKMAQVSSGFRIRLSHVPIARHSGESSTSKNDQIALRMALERPTVFEIHFGFPGGCCGIAMTRLGKPTQGPSRVIRCSFVEPFARAWSHCVDVFGLNLTKIFQKWLD